MEKHKIAQVTAQLQVRTVKCMYLSSHTSGFWYTIQGNNRLPGTPVFTTVSTRILILGVQHTTNITFFRTCHTYIRTFRLVSQFILYGGLPYHNTSNIQPRCTTIQYRTISIPPYGHEFTYQQCQTYHKNNGPSHGSV